MGNILFGFGLAWFLVVASLAPAAHGANIFANTGPLATARDEHSATLLPDGKVLVAGGFDGGNLFLSSAELYDPAIGTWAATGSLASGRIGHTATLLPNGKVLVAGGYAGASTFLASAELYDPATGTWSATGSLTAERAGHTATLLPDGKVLVAGGNKIGGVLHSAEIYDPSSGTWSNTGSLATARARHTGTLLPNGKVLVAGGIDGNPLASAELYDPAAGTWTATGSLTAERAGHTATLLPNGQVLVAGGNKIGGVLPSAELYDPATGTWVATGTLATARYSHTATLLPNGKVLVAGGYDDSDFLTSAELYDPATFNWSATGSLATERYRHTATLLPNGKVLVAAGFSQGSSYVASAEIYESAAGAWSNTGSLVKARYIHTATLLPDGQILVAGGFSQGIGNFASAELYDPASGTWSETGFLSQARSGHSATLLPSGHVLVSGGSGGPNFPERAELYDPITRAWSNTGALVDPRNNHTATLLPDGRVLIVGGAKLTGAIGNAELYDPATGIWSATGSLAKPRVFHTTTLLPNGLVLVAAGYAAGTYFTSAELYDPATGHWTEIQPLVTARSRHVATLLPSGKVLVSGGFNGTWTDSAELYDPVAGTWETISALTSKRVSHTATLLPNGKVLVAGGFDGDINLASAELYDQATGAWSAITGGFLTTARSEHTATLLPGGKLLVAGGNAGSLGSAELYDVGLGFSGAWQPQINSASISASGKLVLAGIRFRGISSASGGNGSQDSPTSYPIVQLRRLDNEQTRFLASDPTVNISGTSFTSSALPSLHLGHALVTVFANGIPSPSEMVLLAPEIAVEQPAGTDLVDGGTPIITFGDQTVGTASPAKTFTIRNTSSFLLTISSEGVALGNSAHFAVDTSGMFTNVPAGGSTTFSVNFQPASAGGKDTTLQIFSNDPDESSFLISLAGTGLPMPNQPPTLGAISDPAAIFENAGAQTVNLSGISAGPTNEAGQVLIVTATSDNPGLIPNPTVTYTSPNATGSLSYTPAANACGIAVIKVRVQDDSGTANGGVDFVERTFTVTVSDASAPVPVLASLPTLSDQCSVTITTQPTAFDNCEGNIIGATGDPLTYSTPGTHLVTWIYIDGHGNSSTQTQTVIVSDTGLPGSNLASLPVLSGECSVTISDRPAAFDSCIGTITATTSDSLTYNVEGTNTVTWTYDDGRGNVATQTQTVVVKDSSPPQPDLIALPVLTGQCLIVVTNAPTATDACAGRVSGTTTNLLVYTNQGTYVITWTYDDGNRNRSTQPQTVMVIADTTEPVINCPGDISLSNGLQASGVTLHEEDLGSVTATDNCQGVRITRTGIPPGNIFPIGTTIITNIAVDASGNMATCLQQVIIRGTLPARIVVAPIHQEKVTLGSDVTLRVLAEGSEPLSYQWFLGDAALPGQTNAMLHLSAIKTNDAGAYGVVVTNTFGNDHATAVLTLATPEVPPQDPRIIDFSISPSALPVKAGTDLTFVIVAGGTSPLTYEWRLNDIPLPGATEPILKLSNVQIENEGVYKAVVTNAHGSVSGPEIVLSVIPATESASITREPASQNATVGDTVTFTVDALGSEPLVFQWRLNRMNLEDRTNTLERGELSGAKTRTLTIRNVQPGDGGKYDVIVRNGLGIEESAVAELLIELPDGGPFAFSDEFVDPSRITFTSSHETIRSINVNATRVPGEPLHAGKFGNHSVWLSWRAPATGIATFDTQGSSFDTLLAVYTGDRIDNLVGLAGDDDGGGFLTSKVRFNAVPDMEYKIAVDGLGAGNGNLVLNWDLDETENALPTIRRHPESLTVQVGGSAIFTIDAVGNGLAYQWKLNGTNVPGANAPVFQVSDVGLKDLGSYIVEVTASGGAAIESNLATLQIGRGTPVRFQNKIEELFIDDKGSPNPVSLVVLSASTLSPQTRHSHAWPIQLESIQGSGSVSEGGSDGLSFDGPAPPGSCEPGGQPKWLLFRADTDGNLLLDTKGSKVPSFLEVWRGTNLASFHFVVCKKAVKTVNAASVGLQVTNGFFYAVGVDVKSGDGGILALNWTLIGPTFRILLLSTDRQVGQLVLDIESNGLRTIRAIFKAVNATEKISVPFGITPASESGSGLARFYIEKPRTPYLVVLDTLSPTNDVAKLKVGWDIPLRISPKFDSVRKGSVSEVSISWEGSGFNVQTSGVVQGADWNFLGGSSPLTITNLTSNAFFRMISDVTRRELPVSDFFQ